LSTHLKEKEEKLWEILEHLTEQASKGTPIVVEGKKDVESLTTLGIQGKIISAKTGGKSLLDVVDEIKETEAQEVVLLFDFDRRGKEWTRRLKQLLEREHIAPNTVFWRELYGIVRKEVKDVEGLVSYMETLKSKVSSNS
jgi:2,5-diamino-6-(ribosylamino)-4(3H)-pyrimidinone 5'-phosphate reductase